MEFENKKLRFIGKIWKFGDKLVINIPKSQYILFEPFRDKKLMVTIELIENTRKEPPAKPPLRYRW